MNRGITTETGAWVSFMDYKMVSIELGKGVIDIQDIKLTQRLLHAHGLAIRHAAKRVRNLGLVFDMTDHESLDQWMKVEEEMGVELFDKAPAAFNRMEHIQIIKEILANTDNFVENAKFPPMTSTELASMERKLIKHRAFIEKEKFYK